jgi:hypothetical protein
MSNITLKQTEQEFCWRQAGSELREYILQLHAEGKLDRELEKQFVRSELLRICEED